MNAREYVKSKKKAEQTKATSPRVSASRHSERNAESQPVASPRLSENPKRDNSQIGARAYVKIRKQNPDVSGRDVARYVNSAPNGLQNYTKTEEGSTFKVYRHTDPNADSQKNANQAFDALRTPVSYSDISKSYVKDKTTGSHDLTDALGQREHIRKMGYDTEAAQKELDSLMTPTEEVIALEKKVSSGDATDEDRTRLTELYDLFEEDPSYAERAEKEVDSRRSTLRREIKEIGDYQTMVGYYGLMANDDFEINSGRTTDWNKYDKAVYGEDYNDPLERLNADQLREYGRIRQESGAEAADNYMAQVLDYDGGEWYPNGIYLSDEEKKIFNYILNTQGDSAAEKYLRNMESTANYRAALADYASKNHTGISGLLNDYGAYISGGIERGIMGFGNIFTNEAMPNSKSEQYSAIVRKNRVNNAGSGIGKWVEGAAADVLTSTGQMIPAMMIGLFNPTAGTIAFSASAGGNYKQEALRLGYTAEQATQYGILAGASEGVLEKLLGGVVKVGGGALGNLASSGMTKISNVLARCSVNNELMLRFGAKYLGNIAGEFADEYLQEILDPVFRNICLDENNEFKPFTEEALYSGIIGALNAGILNIAAIPETYDSAKEGTAANKYRYIIGDLQTDGAASKANPSASNTDVSEIAAILTDAGVDSETAEKMAPSLQTAISEFAARESEVKPDASVETAMQTAKDATAPKQSANDALIAAAKEIFAEESAKADLENKLVTMDKWYENAETNQSVPSESDLPVVKKQDNTESVAPAGRTSLSDSAEISGGFGNSGIRQADAALPAQSDAERIRANNIAAVKESAASLGANGAKVLTDMYSEDMNASEYVIGMTSYYNAGKKGESMDSVKASDALTEPMREAAYLAGQMDAAPEGRESFNGQREISKQSEKLMRPQSDAAPMSSQADTAPAVKSESESDNLPLAKQSDGGYNETITEKFQSSNRYDADGYTFRLSKKDDGWYVRVDANARGADGLFYKRADGVHEIAGAFKTRADAVKAVERRAAELKQIDSESEDNKHGTATLEEVPDGRRVLEPERRGADKGGLLDGVPTENVRGNEGRWNAVQSTDGERKPNLRNESADGVAGNAGMGGTGVSERGDLQSAAGGLNNGLPDVQAEVAEKTERAIQESPRGNNYVIAEKPKLPTTPKSRYKANVEAIRVLRTLMQQDRYATPEEQEILAKYTGWGGLSNVFDGKNGFEKEAQELKGLLDDSEYKKARASILDAYYTEPSIIRGIYGGLVKLGFDGGRLLEPGAGIGRFLGAMPQDLSGKVKSWTAVELDKVTGNIAKYLYPNADVRVMGFETAKIPDNYMDVVVGNVPFGNISVADKRYPASVTSSIHNYFIAKSLDKVRPGGILCVITSSGTMDANTSDAREYFMKQADLIGAIRLPNTAFEGTGTSVVSDILVFKKREAGTPYKGETFRSVKNYHIPGTNYWESYEMNEYFVNHPEMVLGTPAYGKGQYGRTIVTYNPLESRYSLQTQIERAFGKINVKIDYTDQPSAEEVVSEIREASKKSKEGAIVKKDGKLYVNEGGTLRETKTSAAETDKLSAYISIRDTAHELRQLQLEGADDSKIQSARAELNSLYDSFVKKYGYLNSPKNRALIRKDADCYSTLALENYDEKTKKAAKSDIFIKNTISPYKVITHADTLEDAIAVCMNETGAVNPARIASLVGESEETVVSDMLERGLVFKNRDGNLETAEVYLSGNVRAKLRDAEALAEGDASYKRNVEALKAVIPADIPAQEIAVSLGATWIPDSVYSQFASEMLGTSQNSVSIRYNKVLGSYSVEINSPYIKFRSENTSTWGTEDVPFVGGRQNILNAALNNKSVSVWIKSGESRVLDRQATAAAQEKLEKVKSEFQRWMWSDEKRCSEFGVMYNDIFNNTVTPKYDGSGLSIVGMNPDMNLYEHQKSAVQRVISGGGNALLAHRVGAGKTFEMASIAMKLRQLGIVKKPSFIVPKHLVPQWGKEFLKYFPAAKILVLEQNDFTPANRKTFANRIATGDYDAVIMSYEQFGAVPMSAENQEAFYQAQIDALEEAIIESNRQRGKRDPSVRDMERSKKSLEAKMRKLADTKKDENNVSFEELGIDALFVDEAHNFKNLFYTTKMQGISDLGDKEGSQRAFDLYMKVRWLQKLNGGRGIVFATATPIMNSVVELYTMQRYLQGDALDAKGLSTLDAYVNQFGEVKTVRKMKVGGNGYDLRQSLSKYKNTMELQQMFRSFADVIVDAEELPWLKIPKMKGGKRIVVECEPSEFQRSFMQELGKRSDALRGAGKGGNEDHIFKIFDDGKKISYTQRMIDPSLPYEDGGKVMKCVENVYRIWEETKADKMTQLIFCDRGTPGGAEAVRGVNLYQDIKNLLIGKGVPSDEIAFIHDAVDEKQKDMLFKSVREGRVRVLIGSTAKMGTGMNVQDRITALHELNAPDRPGDLEQNEGRALRQGNINEEVGVYVYITKETFDSRQWDTLSRKNTFIHQMMKGEYSGREAVGDGELTLSAAEISAIASGNPLIMEQFDVSEKIANLENLERAHRKEIALAKEKIEKAQKQIAEDSENLSKYSADLAAREDTTGDKFKMTVVGKVFTERKAAGEALIAEAKKHLNTSATEESYTKIGKFAGFDLYVTSKGDMVLRGAAQYRGTVNMQSAVGTIQSLESIPKRLDTLKSDAELRISQNKSEIPKLEKIAITPFDKADELIAARVREAEIMQELNPSSEPEPDAEDNDDSTEYMRDASGSETKRAIASESREEQWQAERVGENKKPKSLSELFEQVRHDFDVNITKGHVRGGGVLGQYNTRNHGIRTRSANDLPTLIHELGHHIAEMNDLLDSVPNDAEKELIDNFGNENKSNYPESQWKSEAFAEYVRKFMQNRETAAIDYPEFTKYFLNSLSGKERALIEQLADEVNAYYSLDADSAASSIRLREEKSPDARTFGEKIKAKSDSIYQAFTDSLNGIKLFDRSTGASTYKFASNAAYADAVAGNMLVGDLTDLNGQYVAPGLMTALNGINLKDKSEYKDFGEYLVVRHGTERLAERMRVFADDRKNSTAFMVRRQAELERKYPKFKEAADRLYAFQRQFLETWGVDTGLISPETAQEWANRWQYYVPFNRKVEKGAGAGAKRGFANQNSTIKRAHGSGLDIIHPVDSIINNIVKIVNAGIRNNVMREVTNAAERLGASAELLEKVPTPMKVHRTDMTGVKEWMRQQFAGSELDDAGVDEAFSIIGALDDVLLQYSRGKAYGDVVTVLKNGKPEFWKINDPLLLESLTSLSPRKMKGVLDACSVITRFMTGNITGNNLIWSLFSNFPRDLMTMLYYTKYSGGLKGKAKDIKGLVCGMGSAYVNACKKSGIDPLYKEYLAMGGGKTSAYTADRDLAKKVRDKMMRRGKVNANPIDWISFMSDLIELGPRFATYKLMRLNGMTPQEAFYESTDITVNFRRSGRISREINYFVPFFNAGVQALDKFCRHITADYAPNAYRKKAIRSRVSMLLVGSAILGMLMAAINLSDYEKKDDYYQLSNYTKNNYFCIPIGDGKYFCIPKPREIAVLCSLFETIIERSLGNEHAFDEFYDYAVDAFLPSVASDFAKGDWEGAIGSLGIIGVGSYMMANRDFLGKPIESAGMQYLEPKDRYNERTSKIAYWVGQAFDVSPQMVDYFFNQTLGGFWKAQKALFPVGGENVDYTLGVYNTYVKDNQYSTDLVNWLYDKKESSAQTSKSNPTDIDKAITAKTDEAMTEFYGNYNKLSKNAPDSTAARGTRQVVLSMINEYRKSDDSGVLTESQKAVYSVCKSMRSTELLPAVMPVEVKDGQNQSHTLSAVQYVEYQLEYNRFYWEYAEEALEGLTDDAEKVRVLRSAKIVAKERATSRVLSRIGAPESKFDSKYGGISGITDSDIVQFRAGIDLANDDGGLTQAEVKDILDDMDLSRDAKQKLWQTANSMWSEKNNPYK